MNFTRNHLKRLVEYIHFDIGVPSNLNLSLIREYVVIVKQQTWQKRIRKLLLFSLLKIGLKKASKKKIITPNQFFKVATMR